MPAAIDVAGAMPPGDLSDTPNDPEAERLIGRGDDSRALSAAYAARQAGR